MVGVDGLRDQRHLDELAQRITDETNREWLSKRSLYAGSEAGYAVFYSPVSNEASLLVVGFNPGGDAGSFNVDIASRVPTQHDYFVYDYLLARRMRALFSGIGSESILRRSVKTNLIFFRTPTKAAWAEVPPGIRRSLEIFCAARIVEIYHALRPRVVLAEGLDTYDRLRPILGFRSIDESLRNHVGRRIYARSMASDGSRLVGLIHPSGARVSNHDWAIIAGQLKSDLDGSSGPLGGSLEGAGYSASRPPADPDAWAKKTAAWIVGGLLALLFIAAVCGSSREPRDTSSNGGDTGDWRRTSFPTPPTPQIRDSTPTRLPR